MHAHRSPEVFATLAADATFKAFALRVLKGVTLSCPQDFVQVAMFIGNFMPLAAGKESFWFS